MNFEIATEADENLEWKLETFDLIRNIRDPEKPETLEELEVVRENLIQVEENLQKPGNFIIKVTFVPTVPHCSLATLIGLCIRTKLEKELPEGKFKIDLFIQVKSFLTVDVLLVITDMLKDFETLSGLYSKIGTFLRTLSSARKARITPKQLSFARFAFHTGHFLV